METGTSGDRRTIATVAVAIAAVAWLGVGIAAVAGVWPPGDAGTNATATVETVPPGAIGHAELTVAAWLEAGAGAEDALAALTDADVDLTGVEPGSRYAARTAVLATETTAEGWLVTVGVDVLRLDGDGYVPDGLHRYAVPIVADGAGFTAADLPHEVR